MVCVKCSAAADLAEAAQPLDLSDTVWVLPITRGPSGAEYATPRTVGSVIDGALDRLHGECPGGTWCDCQHKRQNRPTTLITTASGRTMCTCLDPELPQRPHLCDIVRDRAQRAQASR